MKYLFYIFFGLLFYACSMNQKVTNHNNDVELTALNIDSVKTLRLHRKHLKQFPEHIFNFTNLTKLDISNNQLDSIPNIITQLNSLEELNLSDNKLKNLNSAIFQLPNLKLFRAYGNLIDSIPNVFTTTSKLEYLDLGSNTFGQLPPSIRNLNHLKTIDLLGIQFSEDERNDMKDLLPNVQINFSKQCDCIQD